jgi:hypothetical protein
VNWLREKLGERSTQLGLIILVLAFFVLHAAVFLPPERYSNIKDAVMYVVMIMTGIGGGFIAHKDKSDE